MVKLARISWRPPQPVIPFRLGPSSRLADRNAFWQQVGEPQDLTQFSD
jgi:hypothetical protein